MVILTSPCHPFLPRYPHQSPLPSTSCLSQQPLLLLLQWQISWWPHVQQPVGLLLTAASIAPAGIASVATEQLAASS
uniref:Uncharacterized protein n=1 Tax=Arundo donax TaxID=35708 RepID=A0A0A9D1W5_ARUDO